MFKKSVGKLMFLTLQTLMMGELVCLEPGHRQVSRTDGSNISDSRVRHVNITDIEPNTET